MQIRTDKSDGNDRIVVSMDKVSWFFDYNDEIGKEMMNRCNFPITEIGKIIERISSEKLVKVRYGYVKSDYVVKQGESVSDDMKLEHYQPGCLLAVRFDDLNPLYFYPLPDASQYDQISKRIDEMDQKIALLANQIQNPDVEYRFAELLDDINDLKEILQEQKDYVQKQKESQQHDFNAKIESLKEWVSSQFVTHEIPCIQSGYKPTSSSDYHFYYKADYCIMNTKLHKSNQYQSWAAHADDITNPYIQVMFYGMIKEVTKIQVQGNGHNNVERPTKIEVQGFMPNGKWETLHLGDTNLNDNSTIHTVKAKNFSLNKEQRKIIAGGIKIYIREYHTFPAMRCEVWIKGN